MQRRFWLRALLPCALALAAPLWLLGSGHGAIQAGAREEALIQGLYTREIGPANYGGRITEISAVESDPNTWYAAAATGGVWKSTDGGLTMTPVFDSADSPTASMGAVVVSQSNPNVVYAGTGEGNLRNSVHPGRGVYKSVDAGATWEFMGLEEVEHIGRMVVHPTNPDIVYVAAVGKAWAWSEDRGVFKSTNGGRTWEKVLYFDPQHGAIDLVMNVSEPDTLYAALYRGRRNAFSAGNPTTQFGPHAGIYKTTDGGANWTRLTNGLPQEAQVGRTGLNIYRNNPNIVYAVMQTSARSGGSSSSGHDNNVETGGVYRSEDAGASWTKVNNLVPRPFYYGKIRVDPNNDQRIYVLGVQFYRSDDGGRSFEQRRGMHVDNHAMWISPANSNFAYIGNDGGLYRTENGANTFQHVRSLAIGQYYAIGVDMRRPYWVYGGLQDNGSWGGPSRNFESAGINQETLRRVGGGDGFYCVVDPTDWTTLYFESQYGNLQRRNLRTNQVSRIRPQHPQGIRARFNWNSPILMSPHDPRTIYYGGGVIFKSTNRGDNWQVVSPDLTREGDGQRTSGGNTITVLAESPLKQGLLYAGSDCGKFWVSQDDGANWTDLSNSIPGLPAERWITRLEPSHFDEATVYLTLSRSRNNDHRPYVYRSTNHGASWQSITGDLPQWGQVHVVRESSKNRNLLFVGTDQGLYTTLNGGGSWRKITQVPRTPVHDLVLHPRDRELVVGTHGRSIYVVDVAPLEQATTEVLAKDGHLFDVTPALHFEEVQTERVTGFRSHMGENPPFGAMIHYYLGSASAQPVQVSILDQGGQVLATLDGPREPGLQHVVWDLRRAGNEALVPLGTYTAVLRVGGREERKPVVVEEPILD